MSSSTALAQTGRQPVFAGASQSGARETLDVSASIATAYDEDTRPQEPLPESSVTSRLFTVLTPMIVFTRHDSRVQLGVTAQSNFRYFGDIGQLTTMNHSVGAGLSMNV